MGGVDYTGGCIVSRLDGGFSQGGYTLRLSAGTHHLDGKQALALARTRENLCAPNQTDLQRQEHQQALFNAMKSRLLSPSSFLRLPWIAWNAPPAIISDMSGPTLLGLFGALAIGGTPPTKVLKPSGGVDPARRRGGLTRLRSRTARGRRALHERLRSLRSARLAATGFELLEAPVLELLGRPSRALPSALRARGVWPLRRGALEEDLPRRILEEESLEEESFEEESLPEEDPSAAAAVSRWRLRVP